MSNVAIHTENLGKRYRLGATVDLSRTFREALLGLPKYFYQLSKSKANRLLAKSENPKDTPKGTFWALRDINLDIQHGDVVGIIGRNGAGKSTLLKILSKITSPTSGIAHINGRVGSLLEVGTGFHPELTGRENIYLNGSILGMRKAEIDKKFDEIVSFAEVEQFLDTPIKRYSSGMQVRLAFAVAAHLEPEILIVDEVLAVGDAAFQKKCLGKMEDVSKEGRTVLFVSHNMGAVEQLCQRVITLDKGKITNDTNNVQSGIKEYLHGGGNEELKSEWLNPGNEFDNPYFKPLRFAITDCEGKTLQMPVRNDEEMYVWIEGEVEKVERNLLVGYSIFSSKGEYIYMSTNTDDIEERWPKTAIGKNILYSKLPIGLLNEDNFKLELLIKIRRQQWYCKPESKAPSVNLTIDTRFNESPFWFQKKAGVIVPILEWKKN